MAQLISLNGLHGDVATAEGVIKFEHGVAHVADEIAQKLHIGDIKVVLENVEKDAEKVIEEVSEAPKEDEVKEDEVKAEEPAEEEPKAAPKAPKAPTKTLPKKK